MYNIIPLILILVSLCIIIVIVVRKFSVLASLDVDTIQAEREAKFKEQIISSRLKRNFFRYWARIARITKPVGMLIVKFFKWIYSRLLEVKEQHTKEAPAKTDINNLDKFFIEAEELAKEEKYDEAEKKYIDIIGIDSANVKAFRKLGKLYSEQKNYSEAKQTLEHALRLLEKNDEVSTGQTTEEGESLSALIANTCFEISYASEEQGNLDDAMISINKALAIEPNNPRYLDTKLEISIINKDKAGAKEVYDRLYEVNPENQKLEEIKARIDKIEE